MDPISIATACFALISAANKTSLAVTKFVRGCYEARSDLAGIAGELSQLQLIIELLKDDSAVNDSRITPESLQDQVLSTIKNCMAIIEQINDVVQKHQSKTGAVKWASYGKTEIAGLRMSLEAHRGSLNLMLELVSLSVSKSVKEDTASIRAGVTEIKQDTSHMPQILEELVRLRAIVASGETPPTAHGRDFVLQQYLDNLTSYAETVCGDIAWDSDPDAGSDSEDGSTHTITNSPSAMTGTQDVDGRAESSPVTVAAFKLPKGLPRRFQRDGNAVTGIQEAESAKSLESKDGASGDNGLRKGQASGVDTSRGKGVAKWGAEADPPLSIPPATTGQVIAREMTAEDHLNEGIDLFSRSGNLPSRWEHTVRWAEHFRLAAKLGHPIGVILYVLARYIRGLSIGKIALLWAPKGDIS
ncbi:hypothetical protein B0T22DRAFT_475921 [Podospora appendiculata]|uniref:Azaphilone pigments biosynthesis cluster protein L N-terminal domain-containing protein n=1 Tax=Podospora appendiculata TaxID=314037 RepID=A0AAE0XGK7_9PEZI|nr:hypothetical protein B0T22DRAFT_475921 [Podospora appendiculata]